MDSGRVRAEIIVDGDVQGVGFRYYTRRLARKLGITGYVVNLEDGTVKIVCESHQELIKQFLETIRQAPPPIHVEKTSITYASATGEFKTFKIITSDPTEEMVEGFATGAAYFEVMFGKQDQALSKMDIMIDKQDLMLEKQDQMLQKQDMMLERQDKMLEKQDKMLEKQDLMLQKQDLMLQKQDLMLQRQDKMLEKQDLMLDRQNELLTEVRGLRSDLHLLIEQRISKIERDIEAIKLKIGLT